MNILFSHALGPSAVAGDPEIHVHSLMVDVEQTKDTRLSSSADSRGGEMMRW